MRPLHRYDRFPIEICIDSLESAAAAFPYMRPADGDRFEVCSSLISGGGLTPSIGLVRELRETYPDVELMVMIRPRPGSFVYTKLEAQVMHNDIVWMGFVGATGVVFGCLTPEGHVDIELTESLIQTAKACEKPLQVTFHRAIDVTPPLHPRGEHPEPETSGIKDFKELVTIEGLDRILTSGHGRTALEGREDIWFMSRWCHSGLPVTILPASGINAETFTELLRRAPLISEVHLSASSLVRPPVMDSAAVTRGAELGFGSGEEWRLDPAKLAAMRVAVDKAIEDRHLRYGSAWCWCDNCLLEKHAAGQDK